MKIRTAFVILLITQQFCIAQVLKPLSQRIQEQNPNLTAHQIGVLSESFQFSENIQRWQNERVINLMELPKVIREGTAKGEPAGYLDFLNVHINTSASALREILGDLQRSDLSGQHIAIYQVQFALHATYYNIYVARLTRYVVEKSEGLPNINNEEKKAINQLMRVAQEVMEELYKNDANYLELTTSDFRKQLRAAVEPRG